MDATPSRARVPSGFTGFTRYISPRSSEIKPSTSVIGENIPATAVAMLQASPTTIHIRQPLSRPGTAIQTTPSPSPLSTPVTEIGDPLADTPTPTLFIRSSHSRPSPSPSPLSTPVTEIENPLSDITPQPSPTTTVIRHSPSPLSTPTPTPTTEIENPLSCIDDFPLSTHSSLPTTTTSPPSSPDSRTTILLLHRALSTSTSTSQTDTHLIRTARLVLGLAVQSAAGRIPADIAEKVSAQLFPEEGQDVMGKEEFEAFVKGSVERGEVSVVRGAQILELVGASTSWVGDADGGGDENEGEGV
ncbi:hypothetical protein J4E83_006858 [Alternaria metachromatica]|uniref:uncharacterized protein n=1 Tax=Alternaria metachromatica TaxID=283354 RepID=UPI0020C56AA2|nr:uncharacterized protein J4E83_006858 [Alternaria metachromatica]KAI4615134.1 hypothetical protein J4E83_006858 [Alternaria metachromatica]